MGALKLGDTAPDFEAGSTEGRIRLHEWIGDSWAVLLSHPKDFTPVRKQIVMALCALFALTVGVAAASADVGGNSANAHLCQNGGWQSLFTSTGGTFANEDQCVSYAAQGGTILTTPSPFPATKSACEALGGTFSTDPSTSFDGPSAGGTFVWTCNNGPSQAFSLSLMNDCRTDGGLAISDMTFSIRRPFDSTCFASS